MKSERTYHAAWNTMVFTIVFFFVFALFSGNVQSYGAQTLSGSGTEADPYLINNVADWNTFAEWIGNGENSDAFYKLSDGFTSSKDAAVETIVGNTEHPFSGTLDGNNKTVYVNISDTSNYFTAPFRGIKNATIRNLNVEGEIVGWWYAGGLVGFCEQRSSNLIENCCVKATVKLGNAAKYDGNGAIAGVIGEAQDARIRVCNTAFVGNLSTIFADCNFSGIIGTCKDNAHLDLHKCFCDCGKDAIVGAFSPIAGKRNSATILDTSGMNFYTTAPIKLNSRLAIEGTQAYRSAPDTGFYAKAVLPGNQQIFYSPELTIRANYIYNGKKLKPHIDSMTCDEKELQPGIDYNISLNPTDMKEKGDYTLTLTGTGDCGGSAVATLHVLEGISVSSDQNEWNNNAFRLTEDVTIEDRITVTGDVTLYLEKDKTLTAQKGIRVGAGNRLTIEGEGSLIAYSSDNAGIGGNNKEKGGEITINGGQIDVSHSKSYSSTENAAAIGGGLHADNGKVTINGGTVTCTGYSGAAGIGGGKYGNGGIICINGGTVSATGGSGAAGIGGGEQGASGTITITGGDVYAKGDGSGGGAAIGGGGCTMYSSTGGIFPGNCGTISLLGGRITAPNGRKCYSVGPGQSYFNADEGIAGKIILGWQTTDDYINAETFVASEVSFESGKYLGYYLDDTIKGGVTAENLLTKDTSWKIRPLVDPFRMEYCVVTGLKPYYPYTGQEIKPAFSVYDVFGRQLKASRDYIVSGDSYINPGRYTLKITGRPNNFHGTLSFSYKIVRGSGYDTDPFLITDKNDWDLIAELIETGDITYEGLGLNGYHVKLSDDFDNSHDPFTTSLGTHEHPFSGTFEGNGKTLHVAIDDIETSGTAVFREVSATTIKDLTVKGTVSGGNHTAGLVGICQGNSKNEIDNCVVETDIIGLSAIGQKNIGGVVANADTSNLCIRNTVFSGSMNNSANFAGGLLGWSESRARLTIENCLFCGKYKGKNLRGFHPIAIRNANANVTATINGAYYTEKAGLMNTSNSITDGTYMTSLQIDDKTIYYVPVSEQPYTGSPLEPKLDCIFYGTVPMMYDTDYTQSWENNTEIADQSADQAPSTTVTGKGEGSFSFKIPFSIVKGNAVDLPNFMRILSYKENEGQIDVSQLMPENAGKQQFTKGDTTIDNNGHEEFRLTEPLTFDPDHGSISIKFENAIPGCIITIPICISSERYEDSYTNAIFKIIDEATADTRPQTYEYDGNPHGLNLSVQFWEGGPQTAYIRYSTEKRDYTLTESPTITDAGTLRVYFYANASGDWACIPLESYTDVIVTKAKIEPALSITGWKYGEDPAEPELTGNPGGANVSYTYAKNGSDVFSDAIPTDAGEYLVKATVEESKNYLSGEAIAQFVIGKAAAPAVVPPILIEQLPATCKKVSDVELPEGWIWTAEYAGRELTGQPLEAKAEYIGSDKENYENRFYVITLKKAPGAQESGGKDAPEKPEPAKEGDIVKDDTGAEFKVISIEGATAAVIYQTAPSSGKKELTIPDTVTINGVTYKVTAIANGAIKNKKDIKKLTIGKNVKEIGPYAFKGMKKLKLLIIKTSKLTNKTVDKKAFKGIPKKVKIKVPKSKVKAYGKLFKKKGLPKKVKVKKL